MAVDERALASTGASERCRECGSTVTGAFARTFGDNEDTVHRCLNCDSMVRLTKGSGAGFDVKHPDPLENGERTGGRGRIHDTKRTAYVTDRDDRGSR